LESEWAPAEGSHLAQENRKEKKPMKREMSFVLVGLVVGMGFFAAIGAVIDVPSPPSGRYQMAVDEKCVYVLDTAIGGLYCRIKTMPKNTVDLGTLTKPEFGLLPAFPATDEVSGALTLARYVFLNGSTTHEAAGIAREWVEHQVQFVQGVLKVGPPRISEETKSELVLREKRLAGAKVVLDVLDPPTASGDANHLPPVK
jgi:hypothetical protein